ncbi:unnamed protein product [Trichobilharzia regenti]|nr:unnamed protein product [Trichobilharzia regenti]
MCETIFGKSGTIIRPQVRLLERWKGNFEEQLNWPTATLNLPSIHHQPEWNLDSPSTIAEVPVIDHFYLDINGILHTCSHPEGSKKSVSEEAILRNFLFNLIKPRKTFFMAVDGVAPRAKMTQQRARRFQSALEGRIAKENSKDRSPDGKHFDPCLISPGMSILLALIHHSKKSSVFRFYSHFIVLY